MAEVSQIRLQNRIRVRVWSRAKWGTTDTAYRERDDWRKVERYLEYTGVLPSQISAFPVVAWVCSRLPQRFMPCCNILFGLSPLHTACENRYDTTTLRPLLSSLLGYSAFRLMSWPMIVSASTPKLRTERARGRTFIMATPSRQPHARPTSNPAY